MQRVRLLAQGHRGLRRRGLRRRGLRHAGDGAAGCAAPDGTGWAVMT